MVLGGMRLLCLVVIAATFGRGSLQQDFQSPENPVIFDDIEDLVDADDTSESIWDDNPREKTVPEADASTLTRLCLLYDTVFLTEESKRVDCAEYLRSSDSDDFVVRDKRDDEDFGSGDGALPVEPILGNGTEEILTSEEPPEESASTAPGFVRFEVTEEDDTEGKLDAPPVVHFDDEESKLETTTSIATTPSEDLKSRSFGSSGDKKEEDTIDAMVPSWHEGDEEKKGGEVSAARSSMSEKTAEDKQEGSAQPKEATTEEPKKSSGGGKITLVIVAAIIIIGAAAFTYSYCKKKMTPEQPEPDKELVEITVNKRVEPTENASPDEKKQLLEKNGVPVAEEKEAAKDEITRQREESNGAEIVKAQ